MRPPAASLLSVDNDRLVFEARPQRKLWLSVGWLTLIVVAGLVINAFLQKATLATLFAITITAIGFFIFVMAVSAARASYRVEIQMSTRRIFIADTRGMDSSLVWEGDFDDIGSIRKEGDELRIVWRSGDEGPRLLAPESVQKVLSLRLGKPS